MSYYRDFAEKLLDQYNETVAKTAFGTAGAVSAGIVELDFAEVIKATNSPQTPLLNAIGVTKAKAVTHRWRKYTYRAGAANKNLEGSAAKASVSVVPAAVTNTCQILKGTVEVTRSAKKEAQNGIYGSALLDDLAFQLEAETTGIMSDLELALLNGVEDTSDVSGSERTMKGIIGAAGTYNGFVQTTRTNLAAGGAVALASSQVRGLLKTIYKLTPGSLPNVIIGSIDFCEKLQDFATMLRYNITDPADLLNVPVGQRVTTWTAPWNGSLEIMPHPLIENSATPANNYFAAINTGDLFRADFDPLQRRPVPSSNDGDLYEVLWEGTLECHNENGMGIAYGFNQIA